MTITCLKFSFLIALNKSLKKCSRIKFTSKHHIYGSIYAYVPDTDIRKNARVETKHKTDVYNFGNQVYPSKFRVFLLPKM